MDTKSYGQEVPISVRIETELRDDLRDLATKSDRKFSQEVRRALRLYVINEKGNTA